MKAAPWDDLCVRISPGPYPCCRHVSSGPCWNAPSTGGVRGRRHGPRARRGAADGQRWQRASLALSARQYCETGECDYAPTLLNFFISGYNRSHSDAVPPVL
eukprot:2552506-Pleurochrysis_carterae.AAC.3